MTDPLLTVLGSGTLLPDSGAHSAAHHLRLGRASVLLDCGAGTLHGLARFGVDWRGLTHVAVSHFHNDHIGDLPALMFAMKHGVPDGDRGGPLTLVGPTGFGALLRRMAETFGAHVLDPGFDVRVVEVAEGEEYRDPASDLELSCAKTPHTDESVCYRVTGGWGALGYTGDTGPSAEVAAFLTGCDVLIAECAHADPPATDIHLSPASVSDMAARAEPALLVITHVYPPLRPDEAVAAIQARYSGRVVAGADGLRVRLDPGGPTVAAPGAAV